MLQSLASLNDRDVQAILDALDKWCASHHVDVESEEGQRAMAAAIDFVQAKGFSCDPVGEVSQYLESVLQRESDVVDAKRHRILVIQRFSHCR